MDLVEEVALGYGIENLKSTLPPSISVGEKNDITKAIDSLSLIMIGLGYTEVVNSSLVSNQIQNELTNRSNSDVIQVAESKSLEHTILRDAIIPGILENLSKNIHEQYPQKLFETGIVFSKGNPIQEDSHKLIGILAESSFGSKTGAPFVAHLGELEIIVIITIIVILIRQYALLFLGE